MSERPDPDPTRSTGRPSWDHLRRARWAVTVHFVVTGAALATWTSRIPAIKRDLGLSAAGVTLALLAVAGGSVLAMQVVGHLTDRFGSARVMVPGGVGVSLSLLVPGFANSLPLLVLGLFLFGAGHGATDVSMNTQAVALNRRYSRPILSTFHAMFSVGGLLGSGAGALAAQVGLGAGENFAIVAAVLVALVLIARPALLPPEPTADVAESAGRRGIPLAILFPGVLGFACSLGEGSMADWSPLYLHDELGASPSLAAIGYGVFSACMGLFRFLGDRLVVHFGPEKLVRGCGLVAGTGLGGALLLHHPAAGIVGFGLFGCGLSCIVPQIFNAAGNRDPERSGRDLAQVSTLSYGGLLAGPVLIGLTAQGLGLTAGLAIPAALALLLAASARAVRQPSTSPA